MNLRFTSKMKDMTHTAFKLYVYITEVYEATHDNELCRSHALKYTGLAKSTYYFALEELCSMGFIRKDGCHYVIVGDNNG